VTARYRQRSERAIIADSAHYACPLPWPVRESPPSCFLPRRPGPR